MTSASGGALQWPKGPLVASRDFSTPRWTMGNTSDVRDMVRDSAPPPTNLRLP